MEIRPFCVKMSVFSTCKVFLSTGFLARMAPHPGDHAPVVVSSDSGTRALVR